jgi:hypothetical protein
MVHLIEIVIEAGQEPDVLERRLREVAASEAFALRALVPSGAGMWTVTCSPGRPEMVVGFSKVAELVGLLAREFEVHAIRRLPAATVVAAS